jgi:hypothetical protein
MKIGGWWLATPRDAKDNRFWRLAAGNTRANDNKLLFFLKMEDGKKASIVATHFYQKPVTKPLKISQYTFYQ